MALRTLDLTSGKTVTRPIDPSLLASYLGGLGLAARLMADRKDLDASVSDAPLIVTTGILNATGFPGANRACFFGVSPLTGIFAGSWLGGEFSTVFARTGTRALVLEGKADSPSIVLLHETGTELVPRPDLWGKSVSQTRETLAREYADAEAAVIGVAGERLVSFACIRGNEGHSAGRCGLGAILGSKNVKAILVTGKARPPIGDPNLLKKVSREAMQAIKNSKFLTEIQGPIGTPSLTEMVNDFEALPTGNFQERHFDTAYKIYGSRIAQKYVTRRTTCAHCPVRCRGHVRLEDRSLEAPEYETICLFGSNNRIDDYWLIVQANQLCNDLGLDTISAGNVIAFYRESTGSLDDPSNVLPLVRSIAYREGAGDLLAEGVRVAQRELQAGQAMHVKGLELAGYDPRKLIGMAISYSTANRGGCHSRAWTVADEVNDPDMSAQQLAELVARYHDLGCVKDSIVACTFLDGDIRSYYAPALNAVLGSSLDSSQLRITGERIYTLERMLNIRRGVCAGSDTLPNRILAGMVSSEKYAQGMTIYYRLRDWDPQGRPSDARLKALGLDFARGWSPAA
jgi:aldehyde:ferredoxin oxidoreductase